MKQSDAALCRFGKFGVAGMNREMKALSIAGRKTKLKMSTMLLLIGLVPLIVVGWWSTRLASNGMTQLAFNQLTSLRAVKQNQIERYFFERKGDIGVLADTVDVLRHEATHKLETVQELKAREIEAHFKTQANALHALRDDPLLHQALSEFKEDVEKNDRKVKTDSWHKLAEKYDGRMKDIAQDNGWYDLFLIHADGDIVYTVAREADLGQNLLQGAMKETNLARVFAAMRSLEKDQTILMADFASYAPSNGQMAAFMMGRMKDRHGQLLGYVAFQISPDRLNEIVQRRSGMGTTGETFLVGRVDGRSSLRSDQQVTGGKIGQKKEGEQIALALDGKQDTVIHTGNAGQVEVVSFAPLRLQEYGIHWAILSTIAAEEAFAPKLEGQKEDYYARYIKKYGYYDLMLVSPKGDIFYTVVREPDYGTNLIHGKFAGSNLGHLFRQVIKSGEFGLADFAPYAPSNGIPAAFIVQPVLHDNALEMVVVLQLSLDQINEIMQQKEGMGKTGDAYLVGPDKRMRSDSWQDPQGHAVQASFAGTVEKNGVDTEASREALAGKSDDRVIEDYAGQTVLASFSPIKVGEVTWAVIAKITAAEVREPIQAIMISIVITALLIAVVVAFVIVILRRQLVGVASNLSASASQIAAAINEQERIANLQASSVNETNTTMEELGTSSRQSADQAEAAANSSRKALEAAEHGMSRVDDVLHGMNATKTKVDAIARQILRLSEQTSQISTITATVTDFANETKMLAMNAAVEAVRAGEHGKGFSVLAVEIRKLAEESKRSAERINNLVGEIQKATNTTVMATEEGGRTVDQGMMIAQNTSAAFAEVAESIDSASKSSQQISLNVRQQAVAVKQVVEAMKSIHTGARESATGISQIKSGVQVLNEAAQQLKVMM